MLASINQGAEDVDRLGYWASSNSHAVLQSIERVERVRSITINPLLHQINTQEHPVLEPIHYLPQSYNPHVLAQPSLNQLPEHYRDRAKPTAEDNVPPRFELFILNDGEKKVVETTDTRLSPLPLP